MDTIDECHYPLYLTNQEILGRDAWRLEMEQPYFLMSRRLGFRTWRSEDLTLAFSLWGDPRVTRFIDTRGQLSLEQVQARLRHEMDSQKKYGVQYWPIFLLATGDHAGCCGLRPYASTEGIYEIGFHIRAALWRQGYALEAAQAVMAYAFNDLTVSGLFAGHHPQNSASRALLLKLGFTYTHEEYYPPTGLAHPSYLLRREEWLAQGD